MESNPILFRSLHIGIYKLQEVSILRPLFLTPMEHSLPVAWRVLATHRQWKSSGLGSIAWMSSIVGDGKSNTRRQEKVLQKVSVTTACTEMFNVRPHPLSSVTHSAGIRLKITRGQAKKSFTAAAEEVQLKVQQWNETTTSCGTPRGNSSKDDAL